MKQNTSSIFDAFSTAVDSVFSTINDNFANEFSFGTDSLTIGKDGYSVSIPVLKLSSVRMDSMLDRSAFAEWLSENMDKMPAGMVPFLKQYKAKDHDELMYSLFDLKMSKALAKTVKVSKDVQALRDEADKAERAAKFAGQD